MDYLAVSIKFILKVLLGLV